MTAAEIDDELRTPGQPPRALIVTVYGLYVRQLGGWIGVGTLIRLLGVVGVDAQAVRSSVSRLKRRGILEAERRGGSAGYALSPYAREVLDVGDRRIFERPTHDDDRWVLAIFSVPESERQKRHTLRGRLSWLGYGTVSSGVWIAPAHLSADTRDVLARDGLEPYVDLFAAEYLAFGDPAVQVARWWDLDGLDALYRDFLTVHEPVLDGWRDRSPAHAPDEAFADYVRALTSWRRLPYLDPGLPTRLLPASWSGARAADVFFALRELLAGPAEGFVSSQR